MHRLTVTLNASRSKRKAKKRSRSTLLRGWKQECDNESILSGNNPAVADKIKGRNNNIIIFQEESAKSDNWNKKYIHNTMFLVGYGAYGSVFQVTTRLYSQTRHHIARERYVYHADFLDNYISQRRLMLDQYDKLRDKQRYERLFDTVAIKYEILEQSQLEDGATRFCLFLRREFLVLDTIWRRYHRLLTGFPVVFEFGYIGDKLQYGVNPKYKNIFTYLNLQGEEVKFFADTHNRNLTGVTKISYMSMELLGPSVEDYRLYFEPWYEKTGVRPFLQVKTTFRIVDQLLCRLYVLHKAGFVHHDLKPDNLALGHGRAMNIVYLIDFGFAKQVSDNTVEDWMGSRKYISVDAYSGERANYAQDIESWFYLTVALMYDLLPWSDDVIAPMLELTDETGRWMLAASIKRTWWGDYDGAKTLHSTLEQLQSLHRMEVPDIGQIMSLLHRRVRDLRGHLRHMRDPKAANAELANSKSKASIGYMSIRKVLLQIFDLPNIDRNQMLGDSEFRAYQDARRAHGLPLFPWDQSDFQWEWDCNHQRMVNSSGSSGGGGSGRKGGEVGEFGLELLTQNNHPARIRRQIESLPAYSDLGRSESRMGVDASTLRRGSSLPSNGGGGGSQERADEVSYVFDSRNNCLVPKWPSGRYQSRQRRRRRAISAVDLGGGSEESEEESGDRLGDRASDLWRLANPGLLQSSSDCSDESIDSRD